MKRNSRNDYCYSIHTQHTAACIPDRSVAFIHFCTLFVTVAFEKEPGVTIHTVVYTDATLSIDFECMHLEISI